MMNEGKITLSSGNFRCILIRSGATPLSVNTPHSTWASMSASVNVLGTGGNYSASGITMANVSWVVMAGGSGYKFDAQDLSLSANGVDHLSIIAAVIYTSANNRPVCYASLSTSAINVSDGNKLTITFAASGIFELV
jgi:hypothetical protein